MKYYTVIDTNVVVSAMLNYESVPGKIVELAFSGVIVPLFNNEILNEYANVLSRPKFGLNDEIVSDIISEFVEQGININAGKIDVDMPDLKDIVFYEVVMEGRRSEDAYLVTGNIKHFPKCDFIVTPREMLDVVMESNEL